MTRRIVDGLAVRLTAGDERWLKVREIESVEAYEAFLRGWEDARRLTPDGLAPARDDFETALEIDPDYGRATAALAYVHLRASQLGWG